MASFFDLLFGISDDSKKQDASKAKKRSAWYEDPHSPTFVDYRDKWGSNNDHNWEADGDTRWDSYE